VCPSLSSFFLFSPFSCLGRFSRPAAYLEGCPFPLSITRAVETCFCTKDSLGTHGALSPCAAGLFTRDAPLPLLLGFFFFQGLGGVTFPFPPFLSSDLLPDIKKSPTMDGTIFFGKEKAVDESPLLLFFREKCFVGIASCVAYVFFPFPFYFLSPLSFFNYSAVVVFLSSIARISMIMSHPSSPPSPFFPRPFPGHIDNIRIRFFFLLPPQFPLQSPHWFRHRRDFGFLLFHLLRRGRFAPPFPHSLPFHR